MGFLGCPVQDQESMVLVGPFQLSIFRNSEAAQGCPWHSGHFQSRLSAGMVGANPPGQGELWGAAITLAPVFPYQV